MHSSKLSSFQTINFVLRNKFRKALKTKVSGPFILVTKIVRAVEISISGIGPRGLVYFSVEDWRILSGSPGANGPNGKAAVLMPWRQQCAFYMSVSKQNDSL